MKILPIIFLSVLLLPSLTFAKNNDLPNAQKVNNYTVSSCEYLVDFCDSKMVSAIDKAIKDKPANFNKKYNLVKITQSNQEGNLYVAVDKAAKSIHPLPFLVSGSINFSLKNNKVCSSKDETSFDTLDPLFVIGDEPTPNVKFCSSFDDYEFSSVLDYYDLKTGKQIDGYKAI